MSVCVRACASEKVYYQRSLEKYQGQQQNGELFSSTFFDSMIFFVLLESLGLYRIFSGATPRIISLLPFFFSFFFLVYCTFNTRRGSSNFFFFSRFHLKALLEERKQNAGNTSITTSQRACRRSDNFLSQALRLQKKNAHTREGGGDEKGGNTSPSVGYT